MNFLQRLPISGWTLFCYAMIALASLTGSFITLLGFLGGVVAFVSLLRDPPETLPKEGVWLSLTFASYFAVLAITTTLNGPDPERFIEFVIISPFIYFIPLALVLPVRCTDISMKGLGRAAMIGSVPTAILALVLSELGTHAHRPTLAPGNSNVLAAILMLQVFLCLAGWMEISARERKIALTCAGIGFVGLIVGVGSLGANLTACILALVCLAFWCQTQSKLTQRVVLVAFASGIVPAVLIAGPAFIDMVNGMLAKLADPEFGDWNTSTLTRLTLYRAAVFAIADNPWIGLGQHLRFAGVFPYFAVQPPDDIYYTHVHNLLLTHGTTAGVPGMLAALSLFVCTLYLSLRHAQHSGMVRWLGIVCVLGLFSLGLSETVLFNDLNTTFYMFLFILVAVFSYQARVEPVG